ncbi:MAG: hypothetical protein E4H02_11710 [Lentisphaerales bacterium]|nr:MAG: hypothetical protein E4H02_11710 [Lentisphaerales bacterium]
MKTGTACLVVCGLVLALFAGLLWHRRHPKPVIHQEEPAAPPQTPTRTAPERFPPGTHMPNCPETKASGSIDLDSFSPARDLVRVDNPGIWWESDHDGENDEDDHLMHRGVQPLLNQLEKAVASCGAALKVHDASRPSGGGHCATSLHKEGRALDLTADGLTLEDLAKLCWVAGFDWVFNENKRGAEHVHCSSRASERSQ